MQLIRGTTLALVLLAAQAQAAGAQTVTPLRKEGTTLTQKKAFYVNIGNPYNTPMTFSLRTLESDFTTPAEGSVVRPNKVKLGVNRTRRVIVAFTIPEESRERQIALCVMPEGIEGPVRPRVCGTYTGKRLGK